MSARCAALADLAVVGAGPVGLAAALIAGRAGLDVLLFEPQELPRDKPCGEGIMPSGVAVLEALGLGWLRAQGRPFRALRWLPGPGNCLELPLPAPGLALERPALIAALDATVQATGQVRRIAARGAAQRQGDRFYFETSTGRLSSRALVVADGLGSGAAPWLAGTRRTARGRIGLRARFRTRTPLDAVEVHLVRGCELYVTPLSDTLLNVCALFARPPVRSSARQLLSLALARAPGLRARLEREVTAPELRSLERSEPRTVAEGRAFLAGDAVGGVDPILGCGTAIALATGVAAGHAALDSLAGQADAAQRYAARVARERRLRAALSDGLRWLAAHRRLAGITARLTTRAPWLFAPLVGVAAGRRAA
jgi:flavin-dependent dehydrogenase